MARVETAQDATELAVGFLKPYWAIVRPLRSSKTDGTWVIEVDVGAVVERLGRVVIDEQTGKVVDYSIGATPPV